MELYFLSLLLLVFGGILSIFAKEQQKMKICAIFSGLSVISLVKPAMYSILTGDTLSAKFYLSEIFGNVNLVIDPISAFFLLVISVMSFLGVIYANGYIKPSLNKNMHTSSHSFFLMTLIASMLCVVTLQNALAFLIAWEIMSLSSFFLVIFEGDKKEVVKAGIKYAVYMHICVVFLICAFALLSIHSNSLDFSDFSKVFVKNKELTNIIFLLAFAGFGTKAGLMPFHNWLPDAHPAAPTHVSGIMSGVMIKTGIYGISRMIFLIGMPTKLMACVVLIVSLISALWGVLYAICQHDIKKLLAYHSLENIGIIGIGLGIGLFGMVYGNNFVAVLGFSGGILHILNHSIFKMLLFFGAGNIYKKTHTRNIENLGGLIKKMPYTSALFITGAAAICALPPFNGFVSEFLIYAGTILSMPGVNEGLFTLFIVTLASLALIGTMAILCFTKVTGVMLLGNPRTEHVQKADSDVEKVMLIPMFVLAFLVFFIGIFPHIALGFTLSPVLELMNIRYIPEEAGIIRDIANLIGILSFALFAIILIIIGARFVLNGKSRKYTTWGCGYNKPDAKMQYSASSYADLFISTLKPFFKRISHTKKPKELFPANAYYEVKIKDLEEAYVVEPLIKLDEKILAKFERIQNGNIQQYILFGLIFLVLALIGVIFIG